MAVISSLCRACREVLTGPEIEANNNGACPAACVVVVINETAAKLVIAAASNGLLAQYQHDASGIAAR
eukprot:8381084-Alexandrium_andersonii.AAC.1